MDEDSGPRRPFSILIERFLRGPQGLSGAIPGRVGYKLITYFTHADNPVRDVGWALK